jgi:hypothetical protein
MPLISQIAFRALEIVGAAVRQVIALTRSGMYD